MYVQRLKKLLNSSPKWLYHFTFPPVVYVSSRSSKPSPTFGTISLIILNILIGAQWHFIMVKICISLMTNDAEDFYMLICHSSMFMGEVSALIFLAFSCWIVLLSNYWESFTYFGYKSFIKYVTCKYFLQYRVLTSSLKLSLESISHWFLWRPIYQFFSSLHHTFRVSPKKSLANLRSQIFSSVFSPRVL